ncbi:MAG: hypothetical protein HC872_00635 [Gammaproteobacteria bacterium]|nr:hypothetical protein [Gammaproteobacteria bacterium]
MRGGSVTAQIGTEQMLLGGDIILTVEDLPVGGPEAYEKIRRRLLEVRAGGLAVRITLLRGGDLITLSGSPER